MAPKITLLYDTERGYLSVAHLVRSETNPTGPVVRVKASNYKALMDSQIALRRGKLLSEEDLCNLGAVVLDTGSRLADRCRRDLVAELDSSINPWTIKEKLFAAQRDWGNMTDMLARCFEGFAAFCEEQEVPFIILMHENKREDETTGTIKSGPDANRKLLSEIVENSDYVWRVWREEAAVKINNVQYPKNTHFLRMTTSESKVTKMRLPPEYSEKLTDNLPNPTLQKAFEVLGPFKPTVLTIFGPPGAGKTTLGCTLSDPKCWPQEKAS